MPFLRYLLPFLILSLIAVRPALAIEISEVTVDFPLSEVLDIDEREPETDSVLGDTGGSSRVWRAPWEDNWFLYRQNVLRGNFSEAKGNLDKVLAYRKERGIPNLFAPAAALLVEASAARKQKRYDDALEFTSYARELAPDDPAPHFSRARTVWRQNQLRALSSLDALLEGWGVFFRDFRSFYPWSLGLVLWILVALAVSSILTILLFLPRVVPRLAHDLSHLVKIPQWLWYAAILVLLAAVLVMGLPLVLWVILCALIMGLHLTGRERVAVGCAIVILTSLPLLVHVLALSNEYYSGSGPADLYLAERGGEGARTVESLHRLRVQDPEDGQVLAALAVVLKRSGRVREAETLLAQAMELTPDSPAVINNLGNVLFSMGRVDAAIEHYRQALRYKDDSRIHYNLSQALRENLQLEEGEREFRIANDADPELAGSLTAAQQEGGQRITVDIYGETGHYLTNALTLSAEGRKWREGLWNGFVPQVPFSLSWFLFPVSAVILFLGVPIVDRLNISRRCRKCNRMHCPKCSQSSSDILCAQCRQIFLVRSGVDPASRVKKMMQIIRFNKRRALVSSVTTILLPGMGHIYLGAGWQSLVFITVSTMFWTKWIFWHGLFRNTTMLEIQVGPTSWVVFGLLLGLFYLIAFKSVGDRLEEN
ncbi:MAG: tetratricopeptide repeat protein [bacterium]|nr:tetratricopeptide repeat protein [bacterium]MDT8396488.1 tetratricopeptide repeat protein [bacterium]